LVATRIAFGVFSAMLRREFLKLAVAAATAAKLVGARAEAAAGPTATNEKTSIWSDGGSGYAD
jgi:hypothetical protein